MAFDREEIAFYTSILLSIIAIVLTTLCVYYYLRKVKCLTYISPWCHPDWTCFAKCSDKPSQGTTVCTSEDVIKDKNGIKYKMYNPYQQWRSLMLFCNSPKADGSLPDASNTPGYKEKCELSSSI